MKKNPKETWKDNFIVKERDNSYQVFCYDSKGFVVDAFDNLDEACKKVGKTREQMQHRFRQNPTTVLNCYTWRREDQQFKETLTEYLKRIKR